LANIYAVNSCRGYFTVEAPDGNIAADNTQNFTFAGLPGGTNYLVSLNGQYTAISNVTTASFTVSPAAACGGSSGGYCTKAQDTIVVRDLSDCNWTFHSNLLGTGSSGVSGISPNFFGAGKDTSPYPNLTNGLAESYFCGAGGAQACILDETVPAGKPWGHAVRQGEILRLVDLEGQQTVDFLCFDAADPTDRYSATDTIKV